MCLDLGFIPRISNFIYENIPKQKKNLKSKTFLVPSISDKEYSTCVYTFLPIVDEIKALF
jgi:hypothetical protein